MAVDHPVPDMRDSWRIFRIMAEFIEGFEALSGLGKAVTIFGSARTKPDDPFYLAAEQTSRLLAEAGYAVITGGGPGIMEAGNKGSFDVGGQSAGLNISLPQEQDSNRFQTISLDFHYFYARKVMFVKYAKAFVCFPGGYGTLDEFFETTTLIQTLKAPACPVLLYGSEHWSGLIDWMRKTLIPNFINPEDIEIYRLVDDPQEVIRIIKESEKEPWWRPADEELRKVAMAHDGPMGPMGSDKTAFSGEGTRYGRRPRKVTNNHARPPKSPQQ